MLSLVFGQGVNPVTGGMQHTQRGQRVFGFQVGVEGIDKQHRDLGAGSGLGHQGIGAQQRLLLGAAPKGVAAPLRQRTAR